MNTVRQVTTIGLTLAGLIVVLLGLTDCRSEPVLEPALTPLPTLTIDETSMKQYEVTDFDAAHSPVNGDANEFLIFGNLPVSEPAADLPPELAAFLGRWEGYSYAPPVKKDRKIVLVIQEVTAQWGKAITWSGTNLQYPDIVAEVYFRVIPGDTPSIDFQFVWPKVNTEINTFMYDRETGLLQGISDNPTSGPYELSRAQSFYVYKDYDRYLAGKRIDSKTYHNSELEHYGSGYLLYLPEGYEDGPDKAWPLLFFLHGYGDRGDNVLLLAKASPFMFIREKEPLPFIIAAPLLTAFQGYSSFPEDYMDGAMEEIRADYRVDPKRIYLTGLSMGGEAAYRFALHQPDTFAAMAPLAAYLGRAEASTMKSIKDLPIWAIHGADDTVVPLAKAQQPVDALKKAGNDVRWTVLQGHDHDVWTDTYSDPAFYEWLLQYQRP
jgi:predicted esterase